MPQTVQNLQVLEGVFHFDLHHIVDEMLIAGALGLAQQQLHWLPVVTDVVHHPMHTLDWTPAPCVPAVPSQASRKRRSAPP